MCGIAGFLNIRNDGRLDRMLSSLTHRGPDDEGQFTDAEGSLSMGTRRLSIVDLDGGAQPISNEDGTVTVAFNGEIYNYEPLKADLESKGHRFKTSCDTEVLVHLWEEYATDMPTHLHGMFAFSIWDSKTETLFLCRDRLGIKPLFVHENDGRLVWASELAAVLESGIDVTVDRQSVYRYFSFRYTPQPKTLVSRVRKVPPGHSLTVRDNETTQRRYWSLDQTPTDASFEELVPRVRNHLEASVQRRLMGDVPVGAFLSGGLDSSALVGLMAREIDDVQTYSIGFNDDSVDESAEARFVAEEFGTDHTQAMVDLDSMDTFGRVVERFGEPLADPASLPTLLLADRASEDLKVVLAGEGADELFAGYDRYRRVVRHQPVIGHVPSPMLKALGLVGDYTGEYGKYFRYLSSLQDIDTAVIEAARWYEPDPEAYLDDTSRDNFEDMVMSMRDKTEPLKRMESFDVTYRLPDQLLYKVDHTTMATSLEARVPYLDHELVELAARIPASIKLNGRYKPLLRRAVSDIVPDRVMERNKHGFTVPIGRWFREGHDGIEAWLTEEKVAATPYLSVEDVFSMLTAHRRGDADYKMELWKSLNYVAWYHTHIYDH